MCNSNGVYSGDSIFQCLRLLHFFLVAREKWCSILHHITNLHEWHTCEVFHACEHPPLQDDEARKKKWMKAGSPSHKLLQTIVLDKKLLTALEKLTMFCHTGSLEVYHSVYNKYMPKRQHFSFDGDYLTLNSFEFP